MPFGLDQPTHILIILLVLVLLFGSAKLPKAAKSLGESMRIFKAEAKKLHTDDESKGTVQGPFQQQELPTPAPTMEQAHQMAAQAQQMAAQAAQMAQQAAAGQQDTHSGSTQPPTSQPG